MFLIFSVSFVPISRYFSYFCPRTLTTCSRLGHILHGWPLPRSRLPKLIRLWKSFRQGCHLHRHSREDRITVIYKLSRLIDRENLRCEWFVVRLLNGRNLQTEVIFLHVQYISVHKVCVTVKIGRTLSYVTVRPKYVVERLELINLNFDSLPRWESHDCLGQRFGRPVSGLGPGSVTVGHSRESSVVYE